MATQTVSITITATASDLNAALDSFAYQNGYQDTLSDGSANSETKLQFLKRLTQNYWKDSIKAYNAKKDADAAKISAVASVDSKIALS